MVVEMNCNSLQTIHSCMAVYGTGALLLFQWKSFVTFCAHGY